jgi:predicted YcjX-like family ATPase
LRVPNLRDLTDAGARAFDRFGDLTDRVLDSQIRLGVTGLRRSGKTVCVTALIDNLLRGGRLPFLDVVASGRFQAARLRPQPDHVVPRFDYERHLADLSGAEPHWPTPTRGISEVRIAIRYQPASLVRRQLRGVATLNLDVIDYPGEWLLDLPLLERSYTDWSRETLTLARLPPRAALAQPWLGLIADIDPSAPADETTARQAADLYTVYLRACRDSESLLSLVQPGRFLEPGDLAGAPLLAFCPLPPPERWPGRGSLWALMEARYDAYRQNVVRRFFVDHFARLDRQIVLVDVLSALNAGVPALDDMQTALATSLEAFRHGKSNWLARLLGGRIDKVLFAATKADHIASNQHANLVRLLDGLMAEPRNAIRFEGADVRTMAVAALKCTETVTAEHQGRQLPCVRGIPIGRNRPTVLYTGEIPDTPQALSGEGERRFIFHSFRPPAGVGRNGRGLPNIRVDQALDYLIGDHLA